MPGYLLVLSHYRRLQFYIRFESLKSRLHELILQVVRLVMEVAMGKVSLLQDSTFFIKQIDSSSYINLVSTSYSFSCLFSHLQKKR